MLDSTVPVKTASGRSEITERRHKLGSRQRVLLISISGDHTVREIRQQFQSLGDVDGMLSELAQAELIAINAAGSAEQPIAKSASPAMPAEVAISASALARQFMNESVVAQLGLRAFLFTLKIERCYSRQELFDLLPEYRRLLAKSLGADAVAALGARAEALIANIETI